MTAGTLLVNVDATGLTAGTVTSVPNTGSLGGAFAPFGGDAATTPVIGRPDPSATSGTQGIRFDGSDFLQLVNAAGDTLITAPAEITGIDPNTSIETWVWNPGVAGEETQVAWGFRNGPDGSNMSFNYGNHNDWGAVGHWGGADIGWGPTSPAAGQWHHLVYTFDGDAGAGPGVTRVYIDGQLANSEDLATGALNIHPDSPIGLATQFEPGGAPTGGLRGSLTLGKVRVHTGTLSAADVLANYNEEKPLFVEPVIPPPPEDPAVLLVNVDATTLPAGPITTIPNAGPFGGVFEVGAGTDPVIGTPVDGATGGTRGIRMSGDDYLQLVDAAGGAWKTAPASITGVATSSIETWVWNPSIPDEETMVAWGKRGGPDGTNMSFNYGRHNDWGAMGHWGAQDAGWGGTNEIPIPGQWHHVAHTWDGRTTRIYVDGQETYSEDLGPGALNIHADTPILLGAQLEANGTDVTVPLRGSLTLGKVRIYDGVRTAAEIAAAHTAERPQFVEPVVGPAPAPVKLVDIDATGLPAGSTAAVPNTGTLGGFFEATGGGDTTPVIGTPLTSVATGTRGIRFDGTDYLQLVTDTETDTLITAPASITGIDTPSSIETWVYNPSIPDEETMVSWGHRNGPDGSNLSFNYGDHNDWGALGRWGSPDMGWGPTVPAAGTWHHLVHTFDGQVTRLYVDGQQVNQEILGEGRINVHPDTAITLAAQLEADGFTVTPGLRGSLTLGKVRIYEGTLSPDQIATNYNAERAGFVNPVATPTSLTAGPIHRYSFNEATGTTVNDSVGTAHGTVLGAGATFTGTRLVLPGGSSDSAAYVDFPNGLLSSNGVANGGTGQVTFEGWTKHTGSQSWSRVFDWGSSTAGELAGPGGAGTGVDFFMLTAQTGGDTTAHRYETTDNSDNDPTGNRFEDTFSNTFNTDLHFAVTWNEVTGEVKYFENGREVGAFSSAVPIGVIDDINNWLGRSNFTADANFQGEYDEFRIYNRALTAGEIAGNFQAGANVVNVGGAQVAEVYVRGSGWLGNDNNAANVTFKEFMQSSGVGHVEYGYLLPAAPTNADTVSWINADEIVLRYSAPVSGSGIPTAGTVTIDGTRHDYTVTQVIPIDDRTFALRLDRPLGNITGGGIDGDRIRLTVAGAGPGGAAFSRQVNVLQGDASRDALGRVNAADQGYAKARLNRTTNAPTSGTQAAYTVFADVNGDGRVNAVDQGAIKSRINDGMPATAPAGSLFSDTTRIAEEVLA